ncbi:MAG: hypothetical protein F4Y24_09810 [Gemmatimonadetes bacterium]|nr:hypothetical protein [Gemmatimonadota bacterium]MYG21798.1 hypothetical protein [Gemmatimonadota bacterium]MYJ39933.1 hypothetical protein [Gemmatimonadota bacterium]
MTFGDVVLTMRAPERRRSPQGHIADRPQRGLVPRAGRSILLAAAVVACNDEPMVAPPATAAPGPTAYASLAASTSDRDILVALYEATDGPNWANSENWLTDAPLEEWYGVETDAAGRVTALRLNGRWDFDEGRYVEGGLSGPIPAELGGLTGLESLDLSINRLSGPIPVELAQLGRLSDLSFSINELSGPIPPELSNLANLQSLVLGGNNLTGPIPAELGTMNLGWSLHLEANELTGPIPVELAQLGNLRHLSLGENQLTGRIPAELGGMVNLSSLNLGTNNLSGSIPVELGNLTNLGGLYLSDNALSGSVPKELAGLANLNFLYLRSNDLSGTVPLDFMQLSEMRAFGFEGNEGLCIPPDLEAWYEALESRDGPVCPDRKILEALYESAVGGAWTNADGWLGDGPLGDWHGVEVSPSGRVSTLDLQSNGLSGTLPSRMGELADLTGLRVGDNRLTGRLPASLLKAPLRELRYANTEICVPVESWFRKWLAAIQRHDGTDVECAALTDREVLTALHGGTGGPDWKHSDNWLTDAPLREWHGVRTDGDGRVVELDLRFNELSGSIPPALGGLTELETLILFRNELRGPIPAALGELAKVRLVVLAGNRLSGPVPAELGELVSLEALFLHGNRITSVPPELGRLDNLQVVNLSGNRLTSVPGELGGLDSLRALSLHFNQLASVPPELGSLASLEYLGLWSNELTSVPPELGNLANLVEMDLDRNRLTSVPREFARLDSLAALWLAENELVSVPAELGELGNLRFLLLAENRLADLAVMSGGYPRLEFLDLSSNEFASFPRELSALDSLRQLELDGNRLTDIPPGLGAMNVVRRPSASARALPSVPRRMSESADPWRLDAERKQLPGFSEPSSPSSSRTHVALGGSRSVHVRSHSGGFAALEILDLSSNELRGPLPPGLFEFLGLTSLSVADNAGLTGALPLGLTALEFLEDLHTTGTELCAPPDPEFVDWLEGVTRQRVAVCDRVGAAAYLTQAVQSREFPVPLVAGKPALLRVFVTAARSNDAALPPVRATFYRDGAVTHRADIPAKPGPIPMAISEGFLSRSLNVEIPGRFIQPGLEVVIEPDPDRTLDPALGVASRIPAAGRMAVDVRAMPVLELTVVPFIWEAHPDSSILDIATAMAADPGGHELLERTHLLLPVSEMDVRAHGSVMSSTNDGFHILAQTEMIRVMEGGRGHFLGVMAGPTGPGGLLGVAFDIGSWSSFSVLDSETIAHELGHNRNLYHSPCGGAGGPDRYYPYERGNIGAWGYDFRSGQLVSPGQRDFMSYCEPTWTSDYQFTNAVRYRLETESGSILVAADGVASSSRALLLWGGLDSEGAPHLRPAFFVDAPAALPVAGGQWSLQGWEPGGSELFALSFAMAHFTDGAGDRAGFSFALPATWTGELARITLQGPRGRTASLDRDADDPVTILRDPVTGEVRGILGRPPQLPAVSADAAGTGADASRELEVLFSRGIPGTGNEPR